MVFHSFPKNNCGGDSQSLFKTRFLFSVRLPVAIPVATAGDSTGEARESSYLIRYADWMWFSLFLSFIYLFIFFDFFFFPLSFILLLLLGINTHLVPKLFRKVQCGTRTLGMFNLVPQFSKQIQFGPLR